MPELSEVQCDFVVPTLQPELPPEFAREQGVLRVLLDPAVNAVHVSLLRHRTRLGWGTRAYIDALCEKLLAGGPAALTAREKRAVLWDAESLLRLHRQLWATPGSRLSEWWRTALRQYCEANATTRSAFTGRAAESQVEAVAPMTS